MIKRMLAAAAAGVLAAVIAVSGAHAAVEPSPVEVTPPKVSANDKPTRGVHAPKNVARPGERKRTVTRDATNRLLTTNYFYDSGYQYPPTSGGIYPSGVSVNLVVGAPYLDNARDYHTLTELSVHDATGDNIAEIGFTTDPTVCGAGVTTCLFVYNWVANVAGCYNGCGWVDYAANPVNAGSAVTAGTNKNVRYQWSAGNLWAWYDGAWLGYWPGSEWTGASPPQTFTDIRLMQAFGEIASTHTAPCSDMGNGLPSSNVGSSRAGSYNLLYAAGSGWSNTLAAFTLLIDPPVPSAVWDSTALSVWTFRFGGPGWNAAGTAAGTAGSC